MRIKDKYAGKSGKCPRCGVKIRVARASPINAAFVEGLLARSSPKTDVPDKADGTPAGQSGVSLVGPISAMNQKDH